MNEIRKGGLVMSIEGPFLDWRCLHRLRGEPLFKGDVTAVGERGFTRVVDKRGEDDKEYWCDHITGQLYDMATLKCTSSDRLYITGLRATIERVPKIKPAARGGTVQSSTAGDE